MSNGPPEFDFHPLADLFPLLEGDELQALADDISECGQLQPIMLHEGLILDGRNRYLACQMAEIEPEFVDYDGTNPLGFVLSSNLHRRHLSVSQLAMVAEKIQNMRQGERTDLQPSATLHKVSRRDAAALLGVSERSVAKAAAVLAHGSLKLVEAVESGDISVSRAEAQLRSEQKPKLEPSIQTLDDYLHKISSKMRSVTRDLKRLAEIREELGEPLYAEAISTAEFETAELQLGEELSRHIQDPQVIAIAETLTRSLQDDDDE